MIAIWQHASGSGQRYRTGGEVHGAGKPDSSLVILNGLLKKNPDERQKAYIYYTLSEVYDVTEDMDKQIYYLALTAWLICSLLLKSMRLCRNWLN